MIELRSDTFTLPTARMRAAMVDAPLGDDGYGEDPTVQHLEGLAAQRLGKDAACLMPSGTMANLASIMAHAPRGSTVLVGAESDIYLYEAHGAAVLGGVSYEPIPTQPDGTLGLADLAAGFPDDPDDPQFALPALICLENTHNRSGGSVLPLAYQARVSAFAAERNVPLHLDGARIFNAAVALGVPVAEVAQAADSVQFCLSKGLSAPVGSMVVGSGEFIAKVRRIRRMLGGGMRQAGVLAAAGVVALDEMVQRLADDHATAARLAAGLAAIPGVTVQPAPQTNIVLFHVPHLAPPDFVHAAAQAGVALGGFGHGRIRAVTHSGVTAADVDAAVQTIADVLARAGTAHAAAHRGATPATHNYWRDNGEAYR
jgi:threonine aldolase